MDELTQRRLAEICGVSATRIRQLTDEQYLTRQKNGKYPAEAITEFIEYQQSLQQPATEFAKLLEKEKWREKKRQNDEAEKLLAPVQVIEDVIAKGVRAMVVVLETLPVRFKRHFPEATGDQVGLVKRAVAECRNIMAEVEVDFDDE